MFPTRCPKDWPTRELSRRLYIIWCHIWVWQRDHWHSAGLQLLCPVLRNIFICVFHKHVDSGEFERIRGLVGKHHGATAIWLISLHLYYGTYLGWRCIYERLPYCCRRRDKRRCVRPQWTLLSTGYYSFGLLAWRPIYIDLVSHRDVTGR
jgi:hypothetical protein